MKTILYMATSADGFIAKKDGSTPFSEAQWELYKGTVYQAKNLIIGRNTYELMKEKSDLADLGDPTIVVLTSRNIDDPNVHTAKSPEDALDILNQQGLKTAIVAGGAKCNSAFLEAELINEIILDVESILFGEGIPLFDKKDDGADLKILEIKQYHNGYQVHYRVID